MLCRRRMVDSVSAGRIRGGTMQGMPASYMETQKYDADNDIIYTTKFRMNMKARLDSHLSFTGRLAAYKVWGDSTGVNFNQGSMSDISLDGTSASAGADAQ